MGRPDVHAAYPQIAGSDRAGFLFPLASHLKAGPNRISLEFEAGDGTRTGWSRDFVRLDLEGPDAPHRFRPGIDRPVRSGLPFEVTGLPAFRPGIYDGDSGWSDDLMTRAVADLGFSRTFDEKASILPGHLRLSGSRLLTTRAFKSTKPARPYICRLIIFSRFT